MSVAERSRQQVLEDLVQRYSQELAHAWATEMTHHRVRALHASLQSARAELRELLRGAGGPSDPQ